MSSRRFQTTVVNPRKRFYLGPDGIVNAIGPRRFRLSAGRHGGYVWQLGRNEPRIARGLVVAARPEAETVGMAREPVPVGSSGWPREYRRKQLGSSSKAPTARATPRPTRAD